MSLDASKPVSAFLSAQSFAAAQSSNLVARFSEVVSEKAALRGAMSGFARQERRRRQARGGDAAGATGFARLIGLDTEALEEDDFGAGETLEVALNDETYRAYAMGLGGATTPEQKTRGLLTLLKSMPDLSETPQREVHGFASGAARARRAGLPELPSHLRAQVVVRLVDSLYLLPTSLQILSWHLALQDAIGLLEADRADVQDVLLAFLETHEGLFKRSDALRRRVKRLSGGQDGREGGFGEEGDERDDPERDPPPPPFPGRNAGRTLTKKAIRNLGGFGWSPAAT